jgi:hypothetical protein
MRAGSPVDERRNDARPSAVESGGGLLGHAASAAATVIVGSLVPLDTIWAGRVVITAGLMAALIAFSTLELRASR